MNVIESLIYGLISGLTEFLPVSSFGHQTILKLLIGVNHAEPLRDILIHTSMLLAIIVCCGTYIEKLRRGQKISSRSRRARHIDNSNAYDLRLIKSAALPMLILMLLKLFAGNLSDNLALVALFFIGNGLIIYIPDHWPHSNKDARNMSALDSFVMGLFGALAFLPGFSRVGCMMSCAIARGANKQKAFSWVLVLSIPAIILLLIMDFISIFSVGIGVLSFQIILGYILSAIMAFVSSCCGIYIMQFITVRSGIAPFGFYCWGMALLSFILYLTA